MGKGLVGKARAMLARARDERSDVLCRARPRTMHRRGAHRVWKFRREMSAKSIPMRVEPELLHEKKINLELGERIDDAWEAFGHVRQEPDRKSRVERRYAKRHVLSRACVVPPS